MRNKTLLAVMSVSAIPAVTPALVSADVHGAEAVVDASSVATGAAGIFTLSAGPIPVTEATRLGERKIMALEEAYARKLGWLPQEYSAAAQADEKLAMRPSGISGTWDCTGGGNDPGGGGCSPDKDDGF